MLHGYTRLSATKPVRGGTLSTWKITSVWHCVVLWGTQSISRQANVTTR